jgi:hypothetical protein
MYGGTIRHLASRRECAPARLPQQRDMKWLPLSCGLRLRRLVVSGEQILHSAQSGVQRYLLQPVVELGSALLCRGEIERGVG